MIVRLDKGQQASARRQLLTDVVWAICHDTLRLLLHDKKTTLTPVELYLSARNFCDTVLELDDIDEGIDYEMDDLEDEADGMNDALLVTMLATVQMQAMSKLRVGVDFRKIILHIYQRWQDHELFVPLLQGFSRKEEARWLEGKRTNLLEYELREIEVEGGGLLEKTAFVEEQVAVVLTLEPTDIKSFLLILEKLNVSNNHAFDEQILRLYDKLGVQSISITNNHYAEGSNNQVFNGMIKDSSIISK